MSNTTDQPTVESGQQLVADFVMEAVDSLREVPSQLERYRSDPAADDAINAVFRAVHSIKGCAGFLGLMGVKQFSHSLENTLDDVRKKKLGLSDDLMRALVDGIDLLDAMLQRAGAGQIDGDLAPDESALLERVGQLATQCQTRHSPEERLLEEIESLLDEMRRADLPQADVWAQRIESLLAARACESEEPASSAAKLPLPATFASGEWTCAGKDVTAHLRDIAELFLMVQDQPYRSELAERFNEAAERFAVWADAAQQPALSAALRTAVANLCTLTSSPLDLDAGLLSAAWERLVPALSGAVAPTGAPASKGDTSIAQPAGTEKPADKSAGAPTSAVAKQRMLRVREESVDEFFGHVSRLFISCERFKDLHLRMGHTGQIASLVEELRQINREFIAHSTELQQSVVALRQVPVAGLFSKFPRMARTLAGQIGKKIDVHTSGENVEVDKSIIEDLDAPLTHMIRNVVDHGVESPEGRLRRGVPETGNLWLSAEKTRSH